MNAPLPTLRSLDTEIVSRCAPQRNHDLSLRLTSLSSQPRVARIAFVPEQEMGSHPYLYFTPYQKDIQAALNALRENEFRAGRYDPAMRMASPPAYMFQLRFPLDDSVRGPGAQHASIDDAMEEAEESGTGSILDLAQISSEPDFCAACPLDSADLISLFGSAEPTRAAVESVLVNLEQKFDGDPDELFWEQIERGQGRYIVVYEASKPTEIFFAGYSFD